MEPGDVEIEIRIYGTAAEREKGKQVVVHSLVSDLYPSCDISEIDMSEFYEEFNAEEKYLCYCTEGYSIDTLSNIENALCTSEIKFESHYIESFEYVSKTAFDGTKTYHVEYCEEEISNNMFEAMLKETGAELTDESYDDLWEEFEDYKYDNSDLASDVLFGFEFENIILSST